MYVGITDENDKHLYQAYQYEYIKEINRYS